MTSVQPPHGATDGFVNPDPHEPLVDARIRPLLERYVSLVGAQLVNVADALVELRLPNAERKWFRNRSELRIAFTLDALEHEPEAEIAVLGSAFVDQLVAAIRSRGSRAFHGQLPPEQAPGADVAELRVPITNGSADAARVDVAWHSVVRVLARVVIRAGGNLEEHLLESSFIDAATGIAIPAEIATKCAAAVSDPERSLSGHPEPFAFAQGGLRDEGSALGSGHSDNSDLPRATTRPIDNLISVALASLRASIEPKVARLREDAQQRLQEELLRIDGYYESLLSSSLGRNPVEGDDRRPIEAEHARRRAEEERRHQVRAIVHPVQLTECEVLVQRAQWELVSRRGVRAPLLAQRWLNGSGDWTLACPQCGASSIRWLSVCKSGHVACDTCALTCGVCDEDFCWDHGIGACHVDGHPTCAEHARTCVSCHEPYCTQHEATCVEGDHLACSECVVACVICGREICEEHATLTAMSAPRGQRRLCGNCITQCEGGRSEHVGIDEVTRCVSCGKSVCEHHRSTCAVDQSVQCSTHLRRTDASRRLVCDKHRDECSFEPGAVFASDEVRACAACDRQSCTRHSHTCVEDGRVYCDKDSVVLRNEPGKFICRAHAVVCHVDQGAYRVGQTADCPICTKATCKAHLRGCGWCGRMVCVKDLDAAHSRCTTCAQLRDIAEPSDRLIDAVASALENRPTPKRWRAARDATHTVVELDLGWTRRVVLAVRHGDNVASVGRTHSAVSSKTLNL
jgi:hypothetical protein